MPHNGLNGNYRPPPLADSRGLFLLVLTANYVQLRPIQRRLA